MRFSFAVISAFLLSFCMVSCQQELPELNGSIPPTSDSTHSGNDSTGTTGSYQPLTTGSWWKYKDSVSGVVTTDTVGSDTKTMNGILYTSVVSSSAAGTQNGWMASPSPNYYVTQQGADPNSGAQVDLIFHYLNDTASVGYKWTEAAGEGNGYTANVTTTILAKDISVTVNGKLYNNVTETELDLAYVVNGTSSNYAMYTFFVAKGIGIIKVRTEAFLGGVSVYKTSADLVDYSIH